MWPTHAYTYISTHGTCTYTIQGPVQTCNTCTYTALRKTKNQILNLKTIPSKQKKDFIYYCD